MSIDDVANKSVCRIAAFLWTRAIKRQERRRRRHAERHWLHAVERRDAEHEGLAMEEPGRGGFSRARGAWAIERWIVSTVRRAFLIGEATLRARARRAVGDERWFGPFGDAREFDSALERALASGDVVDVGGFLVSRKMSKHFPTPRNE